MLEQHQSAPGSRISGPDGSEYDIVARVATNVGPFVILASATTEGLAPGVLVSEGDLRDHEDVVFVGTTAKAKADAYEKAQEVEQQQIAEDRQARIDRQKAAAHEGATDPTGTTVPPEGTSSTTPPATPTTTA